MHLLSFVGKKRKEKKTMPLCFFMESKTGHSKKHAQKKKTLSEAKHP